MNALGQGITWLLSPAQWAGGNSIPFRMLEHLEYTAVALVIAAVIAFPLGLLVGHTGHGRVVVIASAGMLRALPTLGLMTLLALLMGPFNFVPPLLGLVLLALPPLLSSISAGIAAVDSDLISAARAMGMKEFQVLFQVELPNALPVIFGGFRSALLQVVATVTVVAYLPHGGLGRFLVDGLKTNDYGQVLGGALLVAVLALVLDALAAGMSKILIPRGVQLRQHLQAV